MRNRVIEREMRRRAVELIEKRYPAGAHCHTRAYRFM